MTQLATDLLLAVSAAATLLLGGVYFGFSGFLMRSLAQSGEAGMEVMTSINRFILRSPFMPLFFGSTVLSAGCGVPGLLRLMEPAGWLADAGGIGDLRPASQAVVPQCALKSAIKPFRPTFEQTCA